VDQAFGMLIMLMMLVLMLMLNCGPMASDGL